MFYEKILNFITLPNQKEITNAKTYGNANERVTTKSTYNLQSLA